MPLSAAIRSVHAAVCVAAPDRVELCPQASNIFIPLCFLIRAARLGDWSFGGIAQSQSAADVLFTLALLVWLASCVGGSGVGGVFWVRVRGA